MGPEEREGGCSGSSIYPGNCDIFSNYAHPPSRMKQFYGKYKHQLIIDIAMFVFPFASVQHINNNCM